MLMSGICPHFNIKYRKRRISDSLTENALCIGLECSVKLLGRCVYVHPDALDAHFLESISEKIDSTAVNGR